MRHIGFIYIVQNELSSNLYSLVLHCTVLYCIVQSCTALYSPVLHCTVLYCIVQSCTALYSLYCCCRCCYCYNFFISFIKWDISFAPGWQSSSNVRDDADPSYHYDCGPNWRWQKCRHQYASTGTNTVSKHLGSVTWLKLFSNCVDATYYVRDYDIIYITTAPL